MLRIIKWAALRRRHTDDAEAAVDQNSRWWGGSGGYGGEELSGREMEKLWEASLRCEAFFVNKTQNPYSNTSNLFGGHAGWHLKKCHNNVMAESTATHAMTQHKS